ncbi:MAG TPA: terminase gpA endonuclease subunit, partial [Caulobacteraceae bacterium]|nr:terminase gpA endonuclease subunit [Caulobacteraceae bacterium]
FSKERIGPLIAATPVLRALMGSPKTRKAAETLTFKAFPGGFLALVGAGSPDNLARRPVRIVLYDEVDKYPVTREGDPLDLGDERLATFVNWLSIRACSPTIEDESRIAASYLVSDQRRASLACPHCGHHQFPDFFKHVEWAKDGPRHRPRTAAVHCEACGAAWSEGERIRALGTIRWRQTRPFDCCGARRAPLELYEAAWRAGEPDPEGAAWDYWTGDRWAVWRAKCPGCGAWPVSNEHAGFQAGKLFSPWPKDTPAAQATKWLAAHASGDQDKAQTWWNTQQGLPYRRHTGKALELEALIARGETFEAEVPVGAAVITVGVDVQDFRLEAEVVGWGENEESWSLAYETIDGEMSEPEVQGRLDAFLRRRWRRADGRALPVSAACVDSGGHHTQAVYNFAKARLGRKIWAIKGESARGGQRNPVWPLKRPLERAKKSFRPVILGVNAAKDSIRDRLIKTAALPIGGGGPGAMHFPADRDLAWFAQLTAERLVLSQKAGKRFRVWELPPGRANEALDCRVYAYAALCGLMHFGLKLNRRVAELLAADIEPDGEGETTDPKAAAAALPGAKRPGPLPQTPKGPPPEPPKGGPRRFYVKGRASRLAR